jgi:hypothetical protein
MAREGRWGSGLLTCTVETDLEQERAAGPLRVLAPWPPRAGGARCVYEQVRLRGLELEVARQRCRGVKGDRASKREKEKRGQQPCYQHGIGLLLPSLQTNAAKRATV